MCRIYRVSSEMGRKKLKYFSVCFIIFAMYLFFLRKNNRRTINRVSDQTVIPLYMSNFVRNTSGGDDILPSEVINRFKNHLNLNYKNNLPIIMTIVNDGYELMLENFYKSSILPLNLKQVLIVSLSNRLSDRWSYKHHPLFLLNISEYLNGYGNFGTDIYYKITNLKTLLVLETLKEGFSVLFTDLDVIILKDPFPYFTCLKCDIHMQMDRVQFNTGFMYIKPTKPSIEFFSEMWSNFKISKRKSHDQGFFNELLEIRKLKHQSHLIKIKKLPVKYFMCGTYYFNEDNRQFGVPGPEDTVVIHNNYIGSIAAKIYRFKENFLWSLDVDGYYTSTNRKYLTYENSIDFQEENYSNEIQALKNALTIGQLLNRIVILPKFTCCSCDKKRISCSNFSSKCSLLSILNIDLFDRKFANAYRENTFLHNSKTKKFKKQDIINIKRSNIHNNLMLKLLSKDYTNHSIVHFDNLYGNIQNISQSLNYYFQCDNHEQWNSFS